MDPKLFDLSRRDGRYAYEAYEFVCEAVTFTQERLGRAPQEVDDPDTDYHVGGEELARGACELAVLEFGLMAPVVFRQWGVHRTDDIGNVVFNLIGAQCLSQSERDDPADFRELFDLEQALHDGFSLTLGDLPNSRRGAR